VANACSDRTEEHARQAGAEVRSIDRAGYGLACWEGGLEVPSDIEWLLYCNADASDDIDALDRFAELSADYDLILGARLSKAAQAMMTPPQRFGNWLAPFLIRCFWGTRFQDLGPQRAIRRAAYDCLMMKDRGFGWTVEMQVRAVEEGLRIIEIPVESFPRPAGESKISGNLRGSLTAGSIILKTIGTLALQRENRTTKSMRDVARSL
jgi:hypothetical protein